MMSYHHTSFLADIIRDAAVDPHPIVPMKTPSDGRIHGRTTPSDDMELRQDTSPAILRSNHTAATSNRPIEDEFLPENIGWPTKVPCGSQKCFYHLKTNRQIGYLVAPQTKSGRNSRLDSGYQLAKQLERDYNITHFLLGPPIEVNVSNELAKRLNRNLYIESTGRLEKKGSKATRFPHGSTVLIQKVKMAPRRHLLLGCVDSKVTAFNDNFPKFLTHVKYKESFVENFSKSLAEAKRILNVEPGLFKDFQVMLDTKGMFHHLDFDRVFSSSRGKFLMPESIMSECLEALDKMERQVRQRALK
jgi:hypothetical protein